MLPGPGADPDRLLSFNLGARDVALPVATAARLNSSTFMRSLLILFVASFALALAGCKSGGAMPDRMRDRFGAPQRKTQTFDADQRAVFEAAQTAMRRLDFQI